RPKVVALCTFGGQDSDDLSFEKGDELTILPDEGGDWFLARDKNGRRGYIPAKYVRNKGGLVTKV
ncbi:tyrosine- kinase BTK, partial [Paramuricea clavata]